VRAGERGAAFGVFMSRVNSALYLGIPTLVDHTFGMKDLRRFASALDDTADEFLYASSLARLGQTVEAKKAFTQLIANPELRDMGSLYWAALYEYSRLLISQGQRADAIRLLQQAAEAIERVRTTITFEADKIGFAASKQAVYAALVDGLAAEGDWRGAFQAAERAKARALVDLLAQHRDLPPPAAADDKVRALFASAQSSESTTAFSTSTDSVRGIEVIASARTALGQLAPESASLVSVQNVPFEAITARLAPDETLIDYYSSGDDLYAFLVTGGKLKGVKLSAKGMEEDVRVFRQSIERRDPAARARAQALYARLLQPVASEFRGSKLTIAPHGPLHYLPFAALLDGDKYLIDHYSIRLIPSAGALAYLKSDHPAKAGRLLALGNPDLGEARYDLPNAQIEATKVAALFPDSRALVRAEASKSAIKELGNGFSILHFATHGKFDANAPLSSGLYLSKGTDSDGVLTVSDLYDLRWDVDLVTLSACETGLGKVANGDDLIGLTRGFLYAGARSIVASLWEVDDAATEELMLDFYRHLDGHDKREALRMAQVETRQHYPEPWYWAAFNIVGSAD
jgi:CHAT domain-containing protein